MELGMVGLGRMGANMSERLVRGGHRVVGYDPSPEAGRRAAEKGTAPPPTRWRRCWRQLKPPRTVWLMVPAGDPVDQTIAALVPLLGAGRYASSTAATAITRTRCAAPRSLRQKGINFVDVGHQRRHLGARRKATA